jgi:hypothetical protein
VSRSRWARSHGQFGFGRFMVRVPEQLFNDLHRSSPLRRRMKLQIHIGLGFAVILGPFGLTRLTLATSSYVIGPGLLSITET